jgi:hypothetical protein
MFDFSKIDSPVSKSYLTPGIYKLYVSDVELVEKEGKTSYLNITFQNENGSVKQKFYLSEKALSNLQYLHEGFFNKRIEKVFENNKQVEAYFKKALLTKKIEKDFIVGGQIAQDGKVYTELPFGNFLVKDGVDYDLGEFEEDGHMYRKFVKKQSVSKSVASSDDVILSNPITDVDSSDDNEDDMPW